MDKTIRRYTDFEELKADGFRYWQSRPVQERLDAVDEMIQTAYAPDFVESPAHFVYIFWE